MRILVVSNLYPPRVLGGYELAAHKLSRALRGRGHEVLVLTSPAWSAPSPDAAQPDSAEAEHEVRALALAAYRPRLSTSPSVAAERDHASKVSQLDNTLVLIDTIRRFRPDHVLLFNLIGAGGLALLDAVDAMGIPRTFNLGDNVPTVLLTQVDPTISAVYSADDGALFRRGTVCAVSNGLVDEIRRDGIDLGKVEVIPRGILPHDIGRSRAYRAGGETRFTAASVLTAFKGIGLIVEAASQLKNQGIGPFRVDIFGGGDERATFEQQARDAGVDDIVTFRGFVGQDELLHEHAAADAFLFPTWSREPGASVPFEAASVGCVPVITRDCGPAEQLTDGVDALLIDATVDSLAAAMVRVCRGEVDLEALGAAGRDLVRGRLSFETSVRRLEELMVSTVAADILPGVTDPAERPAAAIARAIELDTLVSARLDALIVNAETAHVEAAVAGAVGARAPFPDDGGTRFRLVALRAVAPLLWRLDRIAEGVDQLTRDAASRDVSHAPVTSDAGSRENS